MPRSGPSLGSSVLRLLALGAAITAAACGPNGAGGNAWKPEVISTTSQALGPCGLTDYMSSHSAISDRTDFEELGALVASCSDEDTLVAFLGYPVDWNNTSASNAEQVGAIQEAADDALAASNAAGSSPTVTSHFTPTPSCAAVPWSGSRAGLPVDCTIVAVSGALGTWSYEATAYSVYADDPEEGASLESLSAPFDFGPLFTTSEQAVLAPSFLDARPLAGARLYAAMPGSNSAVAHLDLTSLEPELASAGGVLIGVRVNDFATVTLGEDETLVSQSVMADDAADDLVTPPSLAVTMFTCAPSVLAGEATLDVEASVIAAGSFGNGTPAMGAFVAVCPTGL